MAEYAFYGDTTQIDEETKNIMLREFYEELIDEGYTEAEAHAATEMMDYELFSEVQ